MTVIEFIKFQIDFGLVVLIWLVQLVIYPSFTHMNEKKLKSWHLKYTRLVSYVVLPLMLGQVALTSYQLYFQFNHILLIQMILILLLWMSTFFQAVPLHNNIDVKENPLIYAAKLVSVNWLRTIGWSLIGILNFFLI